MNNQTRCTIKDDQLKGELEGFASWLSRQINKTIYTKYRAKQSLKPRYQKELLEKIKTILKNQIKKPLSELTKDDIDQWVETSYNKYRHNSNICRFQAWNYFAVYKGHSDWKVKLPTIEKTRFDTLTEKERQLFIETINKRCEGILNKDVALLTPKEMNAFMERAIALIQTMTVCRPTEVCQIETRNIDLERHKITLKDSKTHDLLIRSGFEDALLTNDMVEQALRDWLKIRQRIRAQNPEDERYLFIYVENRNKGRVIGYDKVLRLCKTIGVEAGITSIRTNPYTLKRTEITRDCDLTNNIRIPQIRARHTDYNSTMRYNHKTIHDVIDYVRSERYDNKPLSIETQMQKLAEKAAKGEIPLDTWEKLRADLLIDKSDNKKKNIILGYG